MARSITARKLFDDLQEKLSLVWVSDNGDFPDHSISSDDLTARPALAGFLNVVHPNRVQVLGSEELDFLESLDADELASTVSRILNGEPLAIVMGDDLPFPELIEKASVEKPIALFRSELKAHELVSYLQYHISSTLASRTSLHGVFMELFTIGVLITGNSGSGKSELALELLTRGHRLIADDAPEFTQISPEIIDGTCPEALQDCLEVRGLGILNVRHMFGDAAVKLNKFLRLIIHLEVPGVDGHSKPVDRLHGNTTKMKVLDLDIPRITLPVMAGRNLSVMAEAAVRDFMLKMKGYDSASVFIERHTQLLRRHKAGIGD